MNVRIRIRIIEPKLKKLRYHVIRLHGKIVWIERGDCRFPLRRYVEVEIPEGNLDRLLQTLYKVYPKFQVEPVN